MKRLIVAIEGPSGVGKDTIISALVKQYPEMYKKIVSYTTRPKRENEKNGKVYNFVTKEQFEQLLKEGDVFEHTIRHGAYRGLCHSGINNIFNQNKIALKDVDTKGIAVLKENFENVLTFYVIAPKTEVKRRLINRGSISPDELTIRLEDYDSHVKTISQFDHVIENLDLDKCIEQMHALIQKKLQSIKN